MADGRSSIGHFYARVSAGALRGCLLQRVSWFAEGVLIFAKVTSVMSKSVQRVERAWTLWYSRGMDAKSRSPRLNRALIPYSAAAMPLGFRGPLKVVERSNDVVSVAVNLGEKRIKNEPRLRK